MFSIFYIELNANNRQTNLQKITICAFNDIFTVHNSFEKPL